MRNTTKVRVKAKIMHRQKYYEKNVSKNNSSKSKALISLNSICGGTKQCTMYIVSHKHMNCNTT